MAHDPIPDKPEGVTVEEAAERLMAGANAWHRANLRSLACMCNTTPEKIEEAYALLESEPERLKALARLGRAMGESLAEAFRPFAKIGRAYRS